MDPEKTDRDEWRIPVRNGQETEKGEAETILGSGGAGRRKKKTDFHADRLSAHSPVPKLCRSQSRVVLQWEGFREDLESQSQGIPFKLH